MTKRESSPPGACILIVRMSCEGSVAWRHLTCMEAGERYSREMERHEQEGGKEEGSFYQ